MEATKLFQLEQGIKDPRSGETVWTAFDQFTSRGDAVKEAKTGKTAGTVWRIVEMKVVWQQTV